MDILHPYPAPGRVFTLGTEIGKCASALKEGHPPNQVHQELPQESHTVDKLESV